jgi:hypothetical protein
MRPAKPPTPPNPFIFSRHAEYLGLWFVERDSTQCGDPELRVADLVETCQHFAARIAGKIEARNKA